MSRAYAYSATRFGYSPYQPPRTSPQVYPEDIQCVYPSSDPTKGSIYVSNVEAASNHLTLSKHNIKAVMTCAKGYDRNIPISKLEMFQYFPFDDKQTCQISPFFQKATNFIKTALQKTNVLVHCIAGVSRSVSMVLAYLIKEKGMSYQQAYKFVKARRHIISPNDGFIRQLKQYAQQIRDTMNRYNKTPEKYQNSPGRSYHTQLKQQLTQKINNTQIKKSQTSINFSNPVLNQQQLLTPRIRKQQTNIDTPYNFRQSFQNNYSIQYVKNISETMIKPMYEAQKSKTPDKQRYIQSQKPIYEAVKERSSYYQQMNQQLNKKIQAIHAKYQKQRQNLLAKRGYSSGAIRAHNSKNYEANLLMAKNDYKLNNNNASFTQRYRGQSNYDIYDHRLSRGQPFTTYGRTNLQRNRYI